MATDRIAELRRQLDNFNRALNSPAGRGTGRAAIMNNRNRVVREYNALVAGSRAASAAKATAGGGTAGAVGGVTPGSMIERWQTQEDEAKAANEARYADILGKWEGLYGNMMGEEAKISDQSRTDVREAVTGARSRAMQNLVDRGLASSTLRGGEEQRASRELQRGLNIVSDTEAQRRLGIMGSIKPAQFGFMERRTDEYPDPMMLYNAMQNFGRLGQAQAGQGFGAGGGGRYTLSGGATMAQQRVAGGTQAPVGSFTGGGLTRPEVLQKRTSAMDAWRKRVAAMNPAYKWN